MSGQELGPKQGAVAVSAAIVWALCLAAQSESSTVASVPLIEVEASALSPQESIDPTLNKEAPSAERLWFAHQQAEGLAPVVDELSGARVLDLGGPGGQQQLTVRGGAPAQALILIDGVPLRLPFATGFDLSLFPLEAFGSVELMKGSQGALLGDGALTGALSLGSKTSTTIQEIVSLRAGSLDSLRSSVQVFTSKLSLGVSQDRTDGDFDYVLDSPGLPPLSQKRTNNQREQWALNGGYRHSFSPAHQLSGRIWWSTKSGGVAGLASQPSFTARESRNYLLSQISSQHQRAGYQLKLSAMASWMQIDYADQEEASQTDFSTFGFDSWLKLPAFWRQRNNLSLSISQEEASSTIFGPQRRLRFNSAVAGEGWFGSLGYFWALRLFALTGRELSLLPRLGLSYEFGPELLFNLSFGGSQRAPTLDELYHPPQAGLVGNPQLLAERSWELELNASGFHSGVKWNAAAFARWIFDPILYLNQNAFSIRPENLSESYAVGGELKLSRKDSLLGIELVNELSLELLHAVLAETGEALPTQPNYGGSLVNMGRWQNWWASSHLRWVGPTQTRLRAAPGNQIPAYLRWDLSLGLSLSSRLSLAVQVENLLDHQSLQSVHQIPLPGRLFFFTVRLHARTHSRPPNLPAGPEPSLGQRL